MKNTLLLFSAAFMLTTYSWGQNVQQTGKDLSPQNNVISSNEYKPESGENTLELQFTPFGNTPVSINGIRARWFTSRNTAFRLNLFVGANSDTQITQQADNGLEELKDKSLTYAINVRPGFEKHLKGTNRLSPYFGFEGDIAYQSSIYKSESQNGTDVNYIKTINDNGFFRLGANAIAGVDFYLSKKFYLGTELGFGVSFTKLLSVKVKSDLPGFTEPEPTKRGSSLDIGPNVNAQIRLGYVF
ncbi:MAG: hypothetical protein KDC79_16760 [Cyclobacteriaceae bacterium]|nr:hypothetical protein [Cyclobacteriaceae bacterium]